MRSSEFAISVPIRAYRCCSCSVLRRRKFLGLSARCARQEERRHGLTMTDGTVRSVSSLSPNRVWSDGAGVVCALRRRRAGFAPGSDQRVGQRAFGHGPRFPIRNTAPLRRRRDQCRTLLHAASAGQFRRGLIFANSAKEALAATADGSRPPRDVRAFIIDGNGAALTLLVTIAMAMFGLQISSLVIFYLAVIGISTLAFILRYRDERQIFLLLFFLIASVMLLTPLSTVKFMADTAPIAAIAFSLWRQYCRPCIFIVSLSSQRH